jgi:hypothetical protein
MKTILLSLALAAALLTHARPQCSEIQSATPVLDGMYAGLVCPEGRVTVALRPDTPLPAVGRATVALVRSGGSSRYVLKASNGAYEVKQ